MLGSGAILKSYTEQDEKAFYMQGMYAISLQLSFWPFLIIINTITHINKNYICDLRIVLLPIQTDKYNEE